MTPPLRVRGYDVERLLGSGATGQVWQARARSSGARVALKRIAVDQADRRRRAHAEAALLAALDHPNLVRLHALAEADGAVVLVLDLAEGGSLADLLAARGRLTVGEVITCVAPLAAALGYLHEQDVVHGDVSPANILFTGAGVPLLADVGVARLTGEDADAEATPAYVDPVVAAGSVPGPASDVFMLAAVALHALTGTPPWPETDPDEALEHAARGVLDDVPRRLDAAGVPEAMSAAVLRALSPDHRRRGTAVDLALDLAAAAPAVAIDLAAGRARGNGPATPWSGPRHAALPGRDPQERAGRPEPPARADDGVGPAGDDPSGGRREAGPARPDFDRPHTVRDLPTAPAPTRMIGPRPRPVVPRPASRRGRRRWGATVVGAGMVVLLGVAGLVWARAADWDTGRASRAVGQAGGHSAEAAAHATGRIEPLTSHGQPQVETGQSSRVRSRAAAAVPTSRWRAELERLDALRARAYATRDTGLLRRVYAAGPLLDADSRQLLRVVPPGCGLAGVRTRFAGVRVSPRAGGVVVDASAVLPATRLLCGDRPGAGVAALPSTWLRVRLADTSDGIRIVDQRILSGPAG